MMLEKAIKLLKQYQGYEPMFPDGETLSGWNRWIPSSTL